LPLYLAGQPASRQSFHDVKYVLDTKPIDPLSRGLYGFLCFDLTNSINHKSYEEDPKTGVRVPSAPAPLFSGLFSSIWDLLKLTDVTHFFKIFAEAGRDEKEDG
jgi:hypothetical protein